MLGNKCDLFSIETVPEQEAKQYAREKGAGFFLTSARNGTGISRAFQEALEMRIANNSSLKERVYGTKLSNKGDSHNKHKKQCCA